VSRYGVYNLSRDVFIAAEIERAETAWKRMKGLLGRSALDFSEGKGLWLHPSQGIHTIGMAFPIDVAYLDAHGCILRLYRRLAPFRVAAVMFSARSVLELPAGTLLRTRTEVGDRLEIRSISELGEK
jgi:uncharacterized membrane protein (UPF0127 family)